MTFPGVTEASADHPLYVLQQLYALLTYGQMSYFSIVHGVAAVNFRQASTSGPTYQDLTDGAFYSSVIILVLTFKLVLRVL